MTEEGLTPEVTGELKHAKDMLIKYIPERDYKSRKHAAFGKGFSDMCGNCKSYYKNIHEIGLPSSEFPVSCKGHVLDELRSLKIDDFDNEEEYQEVLTMHDPITWA